MIPEPFAQQRVRNTLYADAGFSVIQRNTVPVVVVAAQGSDKFFCLVELFLVHAWQAAHVCLRSNSSLKPVFTPSSSITTVACGESALAEQIRKCFANNEPLPSALHDAAMLLYRQYLVVGGMPECVMQFLETKDYILVRHTQDTILASYLNDMSKYNNLNEIKKTRLAYDNITVQLSKKNTRFQYKLIKKGGRASEFENAIEWLCLSGIVSQVYKVEQIKKPLENYRDIDAFKIYVSDLGLLCAKKDLAANDVLYMVEEINDFKGGMAENYVNLQLTINGYKTYYWVSERGAEIDFIIQRDGQLIPIEVKSADNTRAKSLRVYMETYKPAYAIKLSAKNFGFEDNKKIVPLYAAFCI